MHRLLKIFFDSMILELWIEDGDNMIVDRGFRSSIGSLEETGFEIRMPAFLLAHQKQYRQQMLMPLDWLPKLGRQLKRIMARQKNGLSFLNASIIHSCRISHLRFELSRQRLIAFVNPYLKQLIENNTGC